MNDMLDSKRGYVFISKAQPLSDLSDFKLLGRMNDDMAIVFQDDADKPLGLSFKEPVLRIVVKGILPA